MTEEKQKFQVNEKFKDYTDQGISAPQVLTFLDNIQIMLRAIAGDIEMAINNIQATKPEPAPEDKEESKEEVDAT
tara:strand:+ start:4769 stop:4993 length:225 start_codon:yes stop_codon:yes gene_type:complete